MLHAVRGIYRSGAIELLETPDITGDADVIITFLTAERPLAHEASEAVRVSEDAEPLDDFEPIVPSKPVRLSDLVLEDRG